jgi:hypothetical protein
VAEESSGPEADDPARLGAAYNHSIYLMLGVGYGAFFVVGLLIYRGVKKNAEHLRALGGAGEPDGPMT